MTSEDQDNGRTKPAYSDEEDDLESEDSGAFSDNVEGKFRSRVNPYGIKANYPVAPLYGVGEVVYLSVPGQAQPAGPYAVVSSSADRMYTLKRQDNGQMHGVAVAESRLLVRQ